MKIMVTGGSGFLGGSVLPRLAGEGYAVSALARSERAASRVRALGAEPIRGDLDQPSSLEKAFESSKADALVNLASLGFGHAPTIVEAAENLGVKRAVFISTTALFTRLNAPSKAIRMEAERTIQDSELQWTIIRPTMIYGHSGDRNIARLLDAVRRFPVMPLPGGGRRLQQPVHVDDVAGAISASLARPSTSGQAYNIAGPEPLTFRQLVRESADAVGRRPLLLPVPLRPIVTAVSLYERLSSQPRLRAEQLERLGENKAFDVEPARAALSYQPRSFREGLRAQAEHPRT